MEESLRRPDFFEGTFSASLRLHTRAGGALPACLLEASLQSLLGFCQVRTGCEVRLMSVHDPESLGSISWSIVEE